MAEIINLNKRRKAKKRADKEKKAAENRIKFGRTKKEKLLTKLEDEKQNKRLDGHKLIVNDEHENVGSLADFDNIDVEQHFLNYPENVRTKLLEIRKIIKNIALSTEGVGELEETLKWNEPSYLTSKTKSGTTIRIDWKPKNGSQYGIYFNCKTTLVENFREMFPELKYEGNRAILLDINEEIPYDELSECIALALTYKLRKE